MVVQYYILCESKCSFPMRNENTQYLQLRTSTYRQEKAIKNDNLWDQFVLFKKGTFCGT